MILTLVALLILVLITLYMATQGFMTSLIVLVSALFSSMLAMGLYEQLSPMLSFRPNYAQGVTFLLIYLLAFVILRVVGDITVPRNIRLPQIVDRVAGGVVGILVALVVVGTTMTGIEMLPLTDSIGGMGNIADATAAVNSSAPETVPPAAVQKDLDARRILPARFMTGMYYMASGKALGGKLLGEQHPDLGAELFGYRHTVYQNGNSALDTSMVTIDKWHIVPPDKARTVAPDTTEGKALLILRTSTKQGSTPPVVSFDVADKGQVLMLTPSQVRLVCKNDKGVTQQYYPIGFLDGGRDFQRVGFGTGYVFDDYAKDVAVQDWVFEVDEGQVPQFLEMKRGGIASAEGKKSEERFAPLASSVYPPHGWEKGSARLTVTVKYHGKPAEGALVLRISSKVVKQKIIDLLKGINTDLDAVATAGDARTLTNLMDIDPTAAIDWSQVLRLAFLSKQLTKKTAGATWEYLSGPMLDAIKASGTLNRGEMADNTGVVENPKVLKGGYLVVVIAHDDQGVGMWLQEFNYQGEEQDPNSIPANMKVVKENDQIHLNLNFANESSGQFMEIKATD